MSKHQVRQQFVENNAPMDQLCYAVSPAGMTNLISDQRFAAWEGAAGSGVATQQGAFFTGNLGIFCRR